MQSSHGADRIDNIVYLTFCESKLMAIPLEDIFVFQYQSNGHICPPCVATQLIEQTIGCASVAAHRGDENICINDNLEHENS